MWKWWIVKGGNFPDSFLLGESLWVKPRPKKLYKKFCTIPWNNYVEPIEGLNGVNRQPSKGRNLTVSRRKRYSFTVNRPKLKGREGNFPDSFLLGESLWVKPRPKKLYKKFCTIPWNNYVEPIEGLNGVNRQPSKGRNLTVSRRKRYSFTVNRPKLWRYCKSYYFSLSISKDFWLLKNL